MRLRETFWRQVLLAALCLYPATLSADVKAHYQDGTVVVTGLTEQSKTQFVTNPESLKLRVLGLNSENGMPISIGIDSDDLVIKPRFRLRMGTNYSLWLGPSQSLRLELPKPALPFPKLVSFEPTQAVIPANTLRLYLHFSEPMAQGQMRKVLSLYREDGSEVPSPFLNLRQELWDTSQTRLTLLLDPGRIKQGVGPNTRFGAPLEFGVRYTLVLDASMKSAAGKALGAHATVSFRVGAANRDAIAPETWQVLKPPANSHAPLTIGFNRIMDSASARRLIVLKGPNGRTVRGKVETDGGAWSLTPDRPWKSGTYRIIVAPELEDVSGNTPGMPFDASAGTIGTKQKAIALSINIGDVP